MSSNVKLGTAGERENTQGHLLFKQERYSEAEESFRQAADERERTLGSDHNNTLGSKAMIGCALFHQGRYSEAEESFRQVADIQERTLGSDHKDTLKSKCMRGCMLVLQEKYSRTEELLRQAIDGQERTLSEGNQDTLDSKNLLGCVRLEQKKYSEAEELFRQAADGQERRLGEDNQLTLVTKFSLGYVIFKQERYNEAEELFRQVVDGREKILGKDHPKTLETVRLIGELKLIWSPPLPTSPTDNPVWQAAAGRLERVFQKGQDSREPYADSEIIEISSLLSLSNPRWSKVPRTYVVLRTIGHLDVLDDMIDSGFSDFWFPVTEQNLPGSLSLSVRTAFFNAQEVILTKSMDLEKGEKGQHCYFSPEDPLPFEPRGVLGNGRYGQVDKVLSLISFKEYARKRVPRSVAFRGPRKEAMKQFIAEIQCMKRLKHRHIVEFVGSYTDTRYVGLIMLPVAEMDLGAYLTRCTVSSHPELRTFFGCLATALEFLHGQKLRHKDIKPGNILVGRGNVLLADFGLSLDFTDASSSTTTSIVHWMTPRYCAPEVAQHDPRNTKSDIWSLGAVFMEMTVILKGKTKQDMDQFFRQHGSQQDNIRCNMAALPKFVAELEGIGELSDNRLLGWTQQMLSAEQRLRPTASSLATSIIESGSFCGICCASSEEDFSDWADETRRTYGNASTRTGSVERIRPGTVEYTTYIHASRNTQVQSLATFGVEERVSWVASRKTTINEDRVYCLLGIFGVFLPFIRGEGEAHARERLEEEIQKRQEGRGTARTKQLSITKNKASFLCVPFRRDLDFVDRGPVLDELQENSVSDSAGWSQRCRSTANPSSLSSTATAPPTAHRRLVLDNANDDAIPSSLPGPRDRKYLSTYLPQASRRRLLLRVARLMRHRVWSKTGTRFLHLGPIDGTGAQALLRKKLGDKIDADGIDELAAALDYMPLALDWKEKQANETSVWTSRLVETNPTDYSGDRVML
ncbi:hypothetical protein CC80DRAFT_542334 [Byssothecium circinans]|uniref:Protein kinase domain-containing protein n=1 Tax=Byssothecium circinans TaxID=147558 RepID=A0A6A5UQ42_9PLEO|nr:hypothetical protein CC80DRAFT_542334 [Byssothecium circinans]